MMVDTLPVINCLIMIITADYDTYWRSIQLMIIFDKTNNLLLEITSLILMFCINLDVDMINVFNFNLCCFIVDTSHQQTGPMPPTATLMQPQVAGTMHGTVPPQQQSGNNSFSTHVFLASLCNCICFFLL